MSLPESGGHASIMHSNPAFVSGDDWQVTVSHCFASYRRGEGGRKREMENPRSTSEDDAERSEKSLGNDIVIHIHRRLLDHGPSKRCYAWPVNERPKRHGYRLT
ncbi:hypothetical protein FRC18_010403 [Serendipita sp. 400]|nr:hypothetical protein FRC18_010403 [Serendipita sp. 400]